MQSIRSRTLAVERGQGLAEYALILGLIAVVAIAALLFLGTSVGTVLSEVGAAV